MNYKFKNWVNINTNPSVKIKIWTKYLLDGDNNDYIMIIPNNNNECFIVFNGKTSIFADFYYKHYYKLFLFDDVEKAKEHIDLYLNKVINLKAFV